MANDECTRAQGPALLRRKVVLITCAVIVALMTALSPLSTNPAYAHKTCRYPGHHDHLTGMFSDRAWEAYRIEQAGPNQTKRWWKSWVHGRYHETVRFEGTILC